MNTLPVWMSPFLNVLQPSDSANCPGRNLLSWQHWQQHVLAGPQLGNALADG